MTDETSCVDPEVVAPGELLKSRRLTAPHPAAAPIAQVRQEHAVPAPFQGMGDLLGPHLNGDTGMCAAEEPSDVRPDGVTFYASLPTSVARDLIQPASRLLLHRLDKRVNRPEHVIGQRAFPSRHAVVDSPFGDSVIEHFRHPVAVT
jgi:hypothetical protein